MTIQPYLWKQEKSQINKLILNLKQLKKEQIKPKVSRKKGITKIRAEYDIEMKKTILKVNETKRWFFEKISKLVNF